MEATRSTRILAIVRQAIARRAEEAEEGAESGFTLIELMVVLLIMAILLAIAIPTFLGVKGGAQDRSAQSDLTNSVTAAKAYYTNNGSYPTSTGSADLAAFGSAMAASEPEMTWTSGTVTQNEPGHNISFNLSNDGLVLVLATESPTGRCWYAEDNEETSAITAGLVGANTTQGITYGELGIGSGAANASCSAATLTGVKWSSSYPAAA